PHPRPSRPVLRRDQSPIGTKCRPVDQLVPKRRTMLPAGGRLPNSRGPIVAARYDQATIWAESSVKYGLVMVAECGRQERSPRQIPQSGCSIAADRQYPMTIGVKLDLNHGVAVLEKRRKGLPGIGAPHPGRLVRAGCDNHAPVGAKGGAQHPAVVPQRWANRT